jgi:hypothetical protein
VMIQLHATKAAFRKQAYAPVVNRMKQCYYITSKHPLDARKLRGTRGLKSTTSDHPLDPAHGYFTLRGPGERELEVNVGVVHPMRLIERVINQTETS